MAKNEFLPFGTADGANVLSADEYQKLTSRSNGFSAGVARSQEFNTVWRQASVMAHVIAQFIADTNNSDVADDGDLDKLQEKLIQALSKNVNNTVPAASLKTAGIAQLSSATDSDSETMAATPKAVKAAYDMASKVSVDILYPVGIVVWFAQNKDPNKLFPGTTWKYIGEDRTVRLAKADGSDVMTTGGADSVKLTVDNMPAHKHSFSGSTNNSGLHYHDVPFSPKGWSGNSSTRDGVNPTPGGANMKTNQRGEHSHSFNGVTEGTGNGTEFSIVNLYIKLMGWYRLS